MSVINNVIDELLNADDFLAIFSLCFRPFIDGEPRKNFKVISCCTFSYSGGT